MDFHECCFAHCGLRPAQVAKDAVVKFNPDADVRAHHGNIKVRALAVVSRLYLIVTTTSVTGVWRGVLQGL